MFCEDLLVGLRVLRVILELVFLLRLVGFGPAVRVWLAAAIVWLAAATGFLPFSFLASGPISFLLFRAHGDAPCSSAPHPITSQIVTLSNRSPTLKDHSPLSECQRDL